MGLITLRPFPHMLTVSVRHFHSLTQMKYDIIVHAGDGIRISTTTNDLLWDDTIQQASDPYLSVLSPVVNAFSYYNNKLLHVANIVGTEGRPTPNALTASITLLSSDGQTWFYTTAANTLINSVAPGNGIFVAVNDPPILEYDVYTTQIATSHDWKPITTSTDGYNWFTKDVPLSTEDRYKQVIFNGTDFKVIGSASVLSSATGDNWIEQYVDFPHRPISCNDDIFSFINDSIDRHKFSRQPESPFIYADNKYVYLAAEPVGQTCISSQINITQLSAVNLALTDNTGYGCNYLISATNWFCYGSYHIHANAIGYLVIEWDIDSEDFHDAYRISLTGAHTYSFSYLSGKKKGVIIADLSQGDTDLEITTRIRNDFSGQTVNPVIDLDIKYYSSLSIDLNAYMTEDFDTFHKTKVISNLYNSFEVLGYGYAFDRWVFFVNKFDDVTSKYVDYVIYSLDGITWTSATTVKYAKRYNTDPGFAEIYPGMTLHESINKKYVVGYQGGSILTSEDGTNWTIWYA